MICSLCKKTTDSLCDGVCIDCYNKEPSEFLGIIAELQAENENARFESKRDRNLAELARGLCDDYKAELAAAEKQLVISESNQKHCKRCGKVLAEIKDEIGY